MEATTYLVLLRGINVGGKNKLPMKDLVDMFGAAGCRRVRSYIQSGNVVFEASPDLAASLPGVISGEIAAKFGFRVPVITRTVEQVRGVLLGNPYLATGAAEDTLHVFFLADPPGPDRVATLEPDRSPPDEFAVRGSEVFARLPEGMARTKLTNAYFDARLATISTARNWRTVAKLLELMEAPPGPG